MSNVAQSLSLAAIKMLAPESGFLGDPVTLYLDDVGPVIGEAVTVGKRRATVVRQIPDGFAVTFRLPFRPETFGPHVEL